MSKLFLSNNWHNSDMYFIALRGIRKLPHVHSSQQWSTHCKLSLKVIKSVLGHLLIKDKKKKIKKKQNKRKIKRNLEIPKIELIVNREHWNSGGPWNTAPAFYFHAAPVAENTKISRRQ